MDFFLYIAMCIKKVLVVGCCCRTNIFVLSVIFLFRVCDFPHFLLFVNRRRRRRAWNKQTNRIYFYRHDEMKLIIVKNEEKIKNSHKLSVGSGKSCSDICFKTHFIDRVHIYVLDFGWMFFFSSSILDLIHFDKRINNHHHYHCESKSI